jgi:carboxylesterase type B
MKPESPDSWSGVRDASVQSAECYQYVNETAFAGDEDCLYLNVYIPELPSTSAENRSVMVWIYGGGLQIGSSLESNYGSGKLMGYDVITVTLNYRLGAFGFLSMGDDVIPGNYGLWDQIAALQWVHDNIAAFGGDPGSVTIFGESAGATSTQALFVSPQTAGLISGVIGESGSVLIPWGYATDNREYSALIAEQVDCPTDNSTLMLTCLQTKTQEQILEAYMVVSYSPVFLPVRFDMTIDGPGGVLPDQVLNLIRSGQYNKVPFLNGLNENEGGLFLNLYDSLGYVFDRSYVTNNLSDLVGNWTLLTGDELTQVTSFVYEEYFSDIDLDSAVAIQNSVQEFISDAVFNVPQREVMTALPNEDGQPGVYSYLFTYQGEFDIVPGTTVHTDELPYIFDIAVDNNGVMNAQDNITSERILTLWTTFAKTGNPNPTSGDVISVTWEAVTSSDTVPYLQIDTELSMGSDFRLERIQFWNSTIIPFVNSYSGNSVL